jgi:Fe-S-cluster containining protein
MRLFLDLSGKVDYDKIPNGATVQDLLDAVDTFLLSHPLPCDACPDSCCKKTWAVEVDNVAARRLSDGGDAALAAFVREKLVLKRNRSMGFRQYVLDKKTLCTYVTQGNRCNAYDNRPVICRLFICAPKSYRYNKSREVIAAAFLQALVMEENMRGRQLSDATLRRYRQNPALLAADYAVRLKDVFAHARRVGWMEDGEQQEMDKQRNHKG